MENFEKETAKVFGKRFRALMAANGDTSATATTKLNVSAAIIAKWRQGKVVPSGEYLKRISEIYCISSDYLLGLSNDALARADELSGASPRKLAKVIYESCRNAVEPLEDSQKDNIYNALTRENLDEVFERVMFPCFISRMRRSALTFLPLPLSGAAVSASMEVFRISLRSRVRRKQGLLLKQVD